VTYVDAAFGLDAFPGDYRLRRMTSTGAVIDDVLFTPDVTKSILSGKDPIVWTGSAYFGTVSRFFSASEGADSLLVRHCPVDATLSVTPRPVVWLQPVTFSAHVTGGLPGYTYSWDFGDFTEHRTEASPVHSYTRPGTYTVTLTVTDSLGESAVRTMTVTVVETIRRRAGPH
jgi:PKD repeat protein